MEGDGRMGEQEGQMGKLCVDKFCSSIPILQQQTRTQRGSNFVGFVRNFSGVSSGGNGTVWCNGTDENHGKTITVSFSA